MTKALLLVVDVQNGFVSDSTRFLVPRLSRLLLQEKFTDVAFTQFINPDAGPYERYLHWFRLKSPEEQQIVQELRSHATRIFQKTVYTAVNDELKKYLSDERIDTVYIAGIDTDCCVLASAIDLFEMGLRPIVLAHYCASNGGSQSHEAALTVLRRLIGTEQIIKDELV